MGYEHNDIAIMGALRNSLEEESPMFERNDIVTTYRMNEAIAEGGGGGGDYPKFNVTLTGDGGAFYLYPSTNDDGYTCVFLVDSAFNTNGVEAPSGESVTYSLLSFGDSAVLFPGNTIKSVSGDAVYDSDTGLITVTGDCTISGYMDD